MTMGDEIMKEKAKMTFALLDINRDGVVSRKDRDACEVSFKKLFKPEDAQMEAMMENLGNLWKLAVFLFETPDCGRKFSKDEFVQNRLKWYRANRTGTIEAMHKSIEHLFKAADVSAKQYFTFKDFQKVHQAFNIDDEELVRKFFDIAGPDASDNCSLKDVIAFYAEFTTGEDATKHKQMKDAFVASGFVL